MKTGKKWRDSWEPEAGITADMLEAAPGVHAGIAELSEDTGSLDVAPLAFGAIKAFARVLTLAKTACRARVHKFTLVMIRHAVLKDAFFRVVVRVCGKSNVELLGGGNQIKIMTMTGVSKLLQLEKYLDVQKAVGALRFDIGRDSNTDMMVVGIPILLTWSPDKEIADYGILKADIATVHIKGDDGHLDFPMQKKGMLTKKKHRESVRAYTKATIPKSHPLCARANWHLLPPATATRSLSHSRSSPRDARARSHVPVHGTRSEAGSGLQQVGSVGSVLVLRPNFPCFNRIMWYLIPSGPIFGSM